MIETIIISVGCVWLFYKAYISKNSRHLLSGCLLIAFLLSRWPLFLPMKLSLGLMAFFAAGFLVYKTLKKSEDRIGFVYALLFILFGMLFVTEAFMKRL